jgi:primosomal protein N' (replication factor Y)
VNNSETQFHPTPKLAVRVVLPGLPESLTYATAHGLPELAPGWEVEVPLGKRTAIGWVIEILPYEQGLDELVRKQNTEKGRKSSTGELAQLGLFTETQRAISLKPILRGQKVFSPELLKLFSWMSEYYGANLAEVIDSSLPRRIPSKQVKYLELLAKYFEQKSELMALLEKRAPLQCAVLKHLEHASAPVSLPSLLKEVPQARSALRALEDKELIVQSDSPCCRALENMRAEQQSAIFTNTDAKHLSSAQQLAVDKALSAMQQGSFAPSLLFGVTGSGKTEVYLRLIEHALALGKSSLVIVPEISLTPQFIDQFYSRLQVPLALLHSQVGAGARWDAWEGALSGEIKVAIGARSSVFAPLQNLGLIVVDEEHETSYKQSEGLRYNARDVAVMRGKFSSSVVVLGSATPSFESLINVQKKRYSLLELPERVSTRPMPTIHIVDMKKIKRSQMPSENISPDLHDALQTTITRGGQAVILYNRRGFASYLQCESCSEVVECPSCSVPLTFHRQKNRLLCHYCNLSVIPPSSCSFCRNPETSRLECDDFGGSLESGSITESVGRLVLRGGGTEKVVDELHLLFPDAKILRMDRDSVASKDSYRRILGSMRSGKADILVGTQMIAKGHDLPGVTLVGIIDADVGLHLPDFRASERAFQLITQAAGRSGRGEEPGTVLVQTREALHPTMVAIATGRFRAFARYELEYRKSLSYPPFGRLLRFVASSSNREEALRGAEQTKTTLQLFMQHMHNSSSANSKLALKILGPAPCPLEKLRGRHRWHILVKSSSAKTISTLALRMRSWKSSLTGFSDFRLAIDVDPMEML